MAENLMCSGHIASNDAFREGWDRTFKKHGQFKEYEQPDEREQDDPCMECAWYVESFCYALCHVPRIELCPVLDHPRAST